jgi:hypothetical protein
MKNAMSATVIHSVIPSQAVQVLPAEALRVSSGVNLDEAISTHDDVLAGDIYKLDPKAKAHRLVLRRSDVGMLVADDGALVHCTARYELMSDDGDRLAVLYLQPEKGQAVILPLSPISVRKTYQLLAVEANPENIGLSDLLCVSFLRGTRITLMSGEQRAIETLVPGDRVLTRDRGAQGLRWIGKATLRAVGTFAPVVITAGTLGNSGDLIVSQHHRMFLYQRRKRAGLVTSELLVQAKHLVDGDRVFWREGGFVDYFSLVFDQHEIIYAEGIPAESLMVNDATVSMLPPDLAAEVKARFPGLAQVQHFGSEAGRNFLAEIGPEALFLNPRSKGGL